MLSHEKKKNVGSLVGKNKNCKIYNIILYPEEKIIIYVK